MMMLIHKVEIMLRKPHQKHNNKRVFGKCYYDTLSNYAYGYEFTRVGILSQRIRQIIRARISIIQ